MIFFRESAWWLLATGMIGLLLGYAKGMPRWGFLSGLFLGPIGWGIIMLLPSQRRNPNIQANPSEKDPASGPRVFGTHCIRCQRSISRNDKVCPHCGNVMVPVRYRVHEKP